MSETAAEAAGGSDPAADRAPSPCRVVPEVRCSASVVSSDQRYNRPQVEIRIDEHGASPCSDEPTNNFDERDALEGLIA